MHSLARLIALGLCAAGACAAQAQVRSVQPAANPVPSAAATAARAAPNPAGLRPTFPAGISSGSGALVSTDPVAATTTPLPANSVGLVNRPGLTGVGGINSLNNNGSLIPEIPSVDTNTAAALATQTLGAGPTVPGPSQTLNSGAGGFSAVDLARSFYFADADHDGDLSRAEASRLSIAPLSFEQMDRNFDGRISRFEYEDATH